MNRHGADLIGLSWEVLLLEDEAVAARAERIASRPMLAAGLPGMPQRFYPLQNEMLAAAVRLGQAARSRDHELTAQAYGRLAASCVACHRVYLHGD
jgi:hypothetical protein